MEVKEIIELMKAISDNGLTKFELEQGDTRLVMKREKQMVTISAPTSMPVAVSTETMETAQQGNAGQNVDSMVYTGNVVYCPLVGTFYSAPSPDAECFVNVGDRVKKGQVIGIVEAMKLMNEIESEYDGVVEAILVNNEDTVEYGQPLVVIR